MSIGIEVASLNELELLMLRLSLSGLGLLLLERNLPTLGLDRRTGALVLTLNGISSLVIELVDVVVLVLVVASDLLLHALGDEVMVVVQLSVVEELGFGVEFFLFVAGLGTLGSEVQGVQTIEGVSGIHSLFEKQLLQKRLDLPSDFEDILVDRSHLVSCFANQIAGSNVSFEKQPGDLVVANSALNCFEEGEHFEQLAVPHQSGSRNQHVRLREFQKELQKEVISLTSLEIHIILAGLVHVPFAGLESPLEKGIDVVLELVHADHQVLD